VDRAAFLTGSAFGLLFLATTLGLLVRRLASQSVRSLSIFGDYFALGLLLAIGVSGMAMRVWGHADVVTYRSFFVSLVALHPLDPPRDLLFLSHFFLGQMLLIYFPFGKLWHSVGIIQTDGKRRGTI
jgi:nitrate reductase gamma subunit